MDNGDVYDVLKDEPGRRVVRIGDRVYRSTGWWTPAVHALLRRLAAESFRYSPRVVGIDRVGREVLGFIPGNAGLQGWSYVVPERGLARAASLLRLYHDTVSGYVPRPDTIWAYTEGPLAAGEIVCHGDFGPWNIVWRDDEPVGILDWDLAGPGRPMDDVAYALEYFVPFRDDRTAQRWMAYPRPPDRRRRMRVFAEAYGLRSTAGLVDEVIRRQLLDVPRVQALAERGLEPQATWVATGLIDELESRAAWTERHRDLFE